MTQQRSDMLKFNITMRAGWRSALQALAVAGADAAPSVVDAALDALQPVVQNLWREAGTQSNDRRASAPAVPVLAAAQYMGCRGGECMCLMLLELAVVLWSVFLGHQC